MKILKPKLGNIEPVNLAYTIMLFMALNLQTGCNPDPIDFTKAKTEEVARAEDQIRKNEEKIRNHEEAIRELREKNSKLQQTKNTRNK